MNATSVKMNQNGHVALTITVLTDTGAGVKAMYACAPGSAPQRVVAWDSVLEVAPGDLRVVRRSSFSVDNPGGINSLDQVPFVAEFTDGSTASMVASVSFAAGPSFALAAGPTISDTLGNGNGVLDPAESSIGVTLPVRNDGSVTATGVTATLISLTPTVTVQTASASYPDLASGASAANATPYVLNVSPSHPCGSSVTLRLTVTSAQGSNDTSLVVPTGSNYPGCAVFTLASPVVVSDASGNGNGNGIADPGESHIALTVPFTKSSGEGTSSGVTGTLTTTTPTATIITGTAAYPNINAGATQGNSTPFVLSLSPSHPCGAPVNLHLSLTADGGLGHAEQDLSIFGGVPALTNTTARTSVGASIPDASSTGVNVSFVVSGVNGPVIDVDFRFDGTSTSATATTTSTGLGHANVGDVVITLTSPGGISVILANHPGPDSSANNMRACTFDDGAATSIQSIGNPAGPITGSFQPFQPLSVFNGLSGSAINGTWTLNVADTVASIGGTAGGQGGFVRNASLLIRNAAVCVAPHCAADFNNSGGLEVQDIFDYLNAWFAGSAAADFNGGGLAVQDIFDYLNAWFAGC
jgi:subtilisin-like proprotein convertase family protein